MPSAVFLSARQYTLRWCSCRSPEGQWLLSGTLVQMIEDPLDGYGVFNNGNDLHGPTTAPADLCIDCKAPLHQKQTLKHSCFNDRSGSILLKNSETLQLQNSAEFFEG